MMKKKQRCPGGTPVEFPKTTYQKNHRPYENVVLSGPSQSPGGGHKWYEQLYMAIFWYPLAAKRRPNCSKRRFEKISED